MQLTNNRYKGHTNMEMYCILRMCNRVTREFLLTQKFSVFLARSHYLSHTHTYPEVMWQLKALYYG